MPSEIVPVVTVQPTLGEVLQEVQDGVVPHDKFWVSCYKTSESSIHTKVQAELDDVDRDLVRLSSDDVGIQFGFAGNGKHGYEYTASCSSLGIPNTRIVFPVQEFSDPERTNTSRPQPITAFDVSPDVSRFATGYRDGSVFVYPVTLFSTRESFLSQKVATSKGKLYARPHVNEVTTLKFFPSSRVLLSSGLDFSLAILPADLPEGSPTTPTKVDPVRTLRGHTRSVTGTAIVDVGRNLLSASLDATVKLWDVPGGAAISTLYTSTGSPILSISLGSKFLESTVTPHTAEGETSEVESKTLFCGLRNGVFEMLDLSTKSSVYKSSTTSTSPLSSIAYASDIHLLGTGAANGVVTIYDVRTLDQPLTSFVRQEGEVTGLAFLPSSKGTDHFGLAISTTDGLPYVAKLGPDGTVAADELVGIDCDPVRDVRARFNGERQELWLSSNDGVVRRYYYN